MPRKGSVLLRTLELLIAELIKKGYKVEFQMDFEEGYVKWKIKQNGR
jgi:hypothetical protein